MTDLSRRAGLPDCAVSSALRKPYAAAEALIADFIQVPAAHIWPRRYNSDGTRRSPQPTENYRARPRFRSVN